MFFSGNMQSCLCHQRQQTHGLQGYGFAASIGARDHDHEKLAPQVEVNWYDLTSQQRVSCIAQVDTTLVVQVRVCAANQATLACFRQVQIELRQQLDRQLQRFGLAANLTRKHTQNALDLVSLFYLQLAERVV